MRFFLTIFLFFFFVLKIQAQGNKIFGQISDENGFSLPCATILIHELNRGTASDANGKFVFENLKNGKYHLHVQYIGYESITKEFKLNNNDLEINFKLIVTSKELKELIIENSSSKTQKEEQSQSVTLVDQDYILKNNAGTFVNSMDKIPGISSINTGTGISKPVIRGLSFNRIIVAENGIKQEGQQWGQDHGLEIDQYNVERVEIIKGPASLMFGSDGIGGVINIRPPLVPQINQIHAGVLVNAKSVNNLLGTSVWLSGNKKGWFYRARISLQDYADYKVPTDTFLYNGFKLPLLNNKLKNTAGNDQNYNFSFGVNKNWGYSSISISNYQQQVGLFSGAHGIPRTYQLQNDGNDRNIDYPSQNIQHFKIISNSNILLGKNWLEIDLGFQQNTRKEFSFPHFHGFGYKPQADIELQFVLQTISGNFKYHFDISENWNITSGLNFQSMKNRVGGFSYLLPNYDSQALGAFVFAKGKIKNKWNTNFGIRADYAEISIKKYSEPVYNSSFQNILYYRTRNPDIGKTFFNLTGSAGLNYKWSEHLNFKLNAGTSFRVAQPNELASNGIHHGTFRHEMGDSTLTPEKGYQTDAGLIWDKKKYSIEFSGFYYYFPNHIFLNPSGKFSFLPDAGQIYQYQQAEAFLSGAEISSDFHLLKNLHFGLGFDYVYARNLENNFPLPFIPPASANIDFEYSFKISEKLSNNFINLHALIAGEQFRTARNEPATNGYQILNLTLGSEFKFGNFKSKVIFGVNNLFNQFYLNHLSRYRVLNLPEPARNYHITFLLSI